MGRGTSHAAGLDEQRDGQLELAAALMAVFQGARLRPVALPTGRVERRPSARVAPKAPVRDTPRIRPTGLLMAAILTGTMLGLVYLTQTLDSNATSLEIRRLESRGQELQGQLLNQRSKVEVDGNPDAVLRAAKQLGLRELGEAIVLKAP
jgi:hypothetical protein